MEKFDNKTLYNIFRTKDERYDGNFFVGVKTTHIYCRPVCYAMPKEENCVYFTSQAAAEKSGFRPCLICRPELSPCLAPIESKNNISYKAKILMEEKINSNTVIKDVCKIINCSDRYLRRIFKKEFGINPIEYVQTCRLLMSKKLLTDTNLSISDIAFSSGFSSVKRFNTLFKNKYRLAPTSFRKNKSINELDDIIIKIGYKKPYRYDDIINFFKLRAIEGVEKIENKEYIRTIQIYKNNMQYKGIIKILNNSKENCLNLIISRQLLPVIAEITAKIKNQFDIYSCPDMIYESIKEVNNIIPNLFIKGTRIPGCIDDFEICVRAIIGQLISVKHAKNILKKIVYNFGEKINYLDKEWINL